ncbi:hypothetical protein O7627_35080 [Solwaraspora sp. WMMD1047]|uniref:hypothetical protein n=1 Tax=Solwaraspora sp. WMMD1047 TaxID=3016102 RepID=UPI002416FAD9|nr:hypothetical protein [Solwaraspora sp. WMMD1047]MDG4834494.1 hypothetical protein [Solwaraspora sp. WMMD1047]
MAATGQTTGSAGRATGSAGRATGSAGRATGSAGRRSKLVGRLGRFVGTPFGFAVLGCLVLAGWALWSGGILDNAIARDVRSSAVYAAPGVDLDEAAAERIIGNRRLVVVILEPGASLRDGCDDVKSAADGTVVLLLARDGDEFDRYGCALLPERDDENFGRAFVAESIIGRGVDGFVDDPLAAMKVIAVNYDLLVRAGTVPDGARSISPSLPRFLVAVAAVCAVVVGATVAWVGARRAGRLAANRQARREAAADRRSELAAATAVLAQQIMDLDRRFGTLPATVSRAVEFRQLAADYAGLLDDLTTRDGDPSDADLDRLSTHVEELTTRCRHLHTSAP